MNITSMYVGVGVSTYKHFQPLPLAVDEVRDVSEILKTHGYDAKVIPDPDTNPAKTELKAQLKPGAFRSGGSLVILWSGHGKPTPEGDLSLIARDSEPEEEPEIRATYLAGVATRTGASQILLILDTCFSGKAVIPAVNVADRIIRELPPESEHVWFGVIASAMDSEEAREGVFRAPLLKLLREGPSDPWLRIRWSAHNKGVRGDDLIDAIVKEWDHSISQRPKPVCTGDPLVMFPNPQYDPDAPDRIVEHLLLAARGVGPGEEGLFFTARH